MAYGVIIKNLKAKELYIVGTKEDSFNQCQDASSRASGSRAKRACQGYFVTWLSERYRIKDFLSSIKLLFNVVSFPL